MSADIPIQPKVKEISTNMNLMLPAYEYDDPSINWIRNQVGHVTPSGPVYNVNSPTSMVSWSVNKTSRLKSAKVSQQVQQKAQKLNLNEEMQIIQKQTSAMLNEVKNLKFAANKLSRQQSKASSKGF